MLRKRFGSTEFLTYSTLRRSRRNADVALLRRPSTQIVILFHATLFVYLSLGDVASSETDLA